MSLTTPRRAAGPPPDPLDDLSEAILDALATAWAEGYAAGLYDDDRPVPEHTNPYLPRRGALAKENP